MQNRPLGDFDDVVVIDGDRQASLRRRARRRLADLLVHELAIRSRMYSEPVSM